MSVAINLVIKTKAHRSARTVEFHLKVLNQILQFWRWDVSNGFSEQVDGNTHLAGKGASVSVLIFFYFNKIAMAILLYICTLKHWSISHLPIIIWCKESYNHSLLLYIFSWKFAKYGKLITSSRCINDMSFLYISWFLHWEIFLKNSSICLTSAQHSAVLWMYSHVPLGEELFWGPWNKAPYVILPSYIMPNLTLVI